MAFGGLLATTVIGNLTGESVLQQFAAEAPVVVSFAAAVAAATIARGPTEERAALELRSGRIAMVVMGALIASEAVLLPR